jgi:hypothetical protein
MKKSLLTYYAFNTVPEDNPSTTTSSKIGRKTPSIPMANNWLVSGGYLDPTLISSLLDGFHPRDMIPSILSTTAPLATVLTLNRGSAIPATAGIVQDWYETIYKRVTRQNWLRLQMLNLRATPYLCAENVMTSCMCP